jgi:hypothetical protein
MSDRGDEKKRTLRERAEHAVLQVIMTRIDPRAAAERVSALRRAYPGLPNDVLADHLTRRAARKTTVEGVGSGAGVTACELAVATPDTEPAHRVAAIGGTVALLIGDLTYTTDLQLKLVLDVAELYEVPYDPADEDDVWLIFKAAVGLKGVERATATTTVLFREIGHKQFRRLLRVGIRMHPSLSGARS